MASKVVQEAVELSQWVESILRFHRDELAQRLTGRWRHLVPDNERFPDLGRLIDVLADDLAERRETLIAAEDRHLPNLAALAIHASERDDAVPKLGHAYFEMRNYYENQYLREETLAIGFEYLIEEHPTRLEAQVPQRLRVPSS